MGCDLDDAVERLQPAGAIYFAMDEADLERILAYPRTMVGSDGLPGMAHPHPRLWGTFPRVLGRYVRERGLIGLEEAVHRMTGLPARTFRLQDRGRLAPGCFADLVVFDPARIADRASFEAPQVPAAPAECRCGAAPRWQFSNKRVTFSTSAAARRHCHGWGSARPRRARRRDGT